jgi:hypothetical protein
MSDTNSQGVVHHAAVEELRTWRAVQLASLLPLALCVPFMFLTEEGSGFGAIVFFLLVASGIVLPEMKCDIAINRLIVMKKQTEISEELRQLLRGELRHFLKDPAIRYLLKEKAVSSERKSQS